MKLLVATRSAHKLREIRAILSELEGLEVVGLEEVGIRPTPEEEELEPWESFEENALSKAHYFHRLSGLPTLSDDSGLVVDALNGAPGVRSKRFSPEVAAGSATGEARDRANNRYLLDRLEGLPMDERKARYVCVVAWIDRAGREQTVRGEVEGRIEEAPSGDGGFGYDPLFFVPELGRTFGLSTPAEKDARSHRGRAFRAILPALRRELEVGGGR